MILAIDFDGPLGWTGGYERLFLWLEKKGHRIDWKRWQEQHHIMEALPDLTKSQTAELAEEFHHSAEGRSILSVPQAREVLCKYKAQLTYVIITARRGRAAENMKLFLKAHYSDVEFAKLYTGYAHRKGEAVTEAGASLILEDNVQEARQIVRQSSTATVLLFPTFLPGGSQIEHDRVVLTAACRDGHRAQSDIDKRMALRAAWYEADAFLEHLLKESS